MAIRSLILAVFFFVGVQVWRVTSLSVYTDTAYQFNTYRSSINNVANLKRLGHDSTVSLALLEYLRLCDGVLALPNGLHVGNKNYFLNVMFTNDSKFNMVTSMVRFAGRGKYLLNQTSLVCPQKNPYCKAYYSIMNSRATVSECAFNYCPHQVKGREYTYMYACAIGPKVGLYTDPRYPAYIIGPPCSHCDPGEICLANLCTIKAKRSILGMIASRSSSATTGSGSKSAASTSKEGKSGTTTTASSTTTTPKTKSGATSSSSSSSATGGTSSRSSKSTSSSKSHSDSSSKTPDEKEKHPVHKTHIANNGGSSSAARPQISNPYVVTLILVSILFHL